MKNDEKHLVTPLRALLKDRDGLHPAAQDGSEPPFLRALAGRLRRPAHYDRGALGARLP